MVFANPQGDLGSPGDSGSKGDKGEKVWSFLQVKACCCLFVTENAQYATLNVLTMSC